MTFDDLLKYEPRLLDVKRAATGWRRSHDPYIWNRYESLKAQMKQYVGAYARAGYPEFFYTCTAYDVAHKAIFG